MERAAQVDIAGGTMPAVLNNALEWLSRPFGTGAIQGKPFAAIGATPTPYGGTTSGTPEESR